VNRWSTLRVRLLFELGFVTSSAVLVVGAATVLVSRADPVEIATPLILLWLGATAVFVLFGWYLVHRLVLRPLQQLAAEADSLAAGGLSGPGPAYETAELAELAARYRSMAESLFDLHAHAVRVEKLAGIGRLAAGVAHEVRNPLGALGNYLEVLQRRGTDPAVTTEMRSAVERIERIVQGLVNYARPGASAPGKPGAEITDLNAAVRTVLAFLGAQGMLRAHQVEVSLDSVLPPVRGDRHLLEQVVVNLVANASQAAPGGRIVVGTVAKRFESRHAGAVRRGDENHKLAAGKVELAGDNGRSALPARAWATRPRRRDLPMGCPGAILFVADSGPGVPEADRERIFDPFFTTKEPGEGTGLGLAIVARTVEESGGLVWVDRAREGGAVFKVFLPLAGETHASADR
jgi:two-component system, NtrC family, sensor kinase